MEVLTVQNQYNEQHYNEISTTRIKSKYFKKKKNSNFYTYHIGFIIPLVTC